MRSYNLGMEHTVVSSQYKPIEVILVDVLGEECNDSEAEAEECREGK